MSAADDDVDYEELSDWIEELERQALIGIILDDLTAAVASMDQQRKNALKKRQEFKQQLRNYMTTVSSQTRNPRFATIPPPISCYNAPVARFKFS
jgi:hypothetical protein